MPRNALLLACCAILACSSSSASDVVNSSPHVDPRIHRTLQERSTVDIIVTMASGTKLEIGNRQSTAARHRRRLKGKRCMERGDKIAGVIDSLQNAANESQHEVLSMLTSLKAERALVPKFDAFRSFWITNQVFIANATSDVIEKLRATPGVTKVEEEAVHDFPWSSSTDAKLRHARNESVVLLASENAVGGEADAEADYTQYGARIMGAPNVWASGTTGEGVVVAILDTGVLSTHEAVRDSFLGDYGWFDPETRQTEPYDVNGHGTAAASIIAGSDQLGVAPGAKWMACKACRRTGCRQSDILACAQWVMCPTDAQGNNRDCTKAPRVVSSSWGDKRVNWGYRDAIDAWRSAGIIPVFANGNAGPGCSTVTYPGGYPNVIAVGSTDMLDALDLSSSKGPAANDVVKPDFVAPGSSIRCATASSDSDYAVLTGSSFAAPHAAGAIALLLSAQPSLSYDQILQTLKSTAFQGVQVDNATTQCGNSTTDDSLVPNNQFGWGRINVGWAVQSLRATT